MVYMISQPGLVPWLKIRPPVMEQRGSLPGLMPFGMIVTLMLCTYIPLSFIFFFFTEWRRALIFQSSLKLARPPAVSWDMFSSKHHDTLLRSGPPLPW